MPEELNVKALFEDVGLLSLTVVCENSIRGIKEIITNKTNFFIALKLSYLNIREFPNI